MNLDYPVEISAWLRAAGFQSGHNGVLAMNAYLFPVLMSGPVIVEKLMQRIAPERIDLPTHPGRFTPREVVAHLADWEPILRSRMERCLSEPDAQVDGIDEGVRAAEMGYGGWDWQEQAWRFAEERKKTAEWLKGLDASRLQMAITHSEKGRQTIYDQANQLLGHDLYHVEQLCEVIEGRAIGTW